MVKRKKHFKKTHIFPDDIVINILGFLKQNGPMILTYDYKQKKFVDTEHPDYTRAKILVQKNKNDWSLQSLRYYFKNLDFRFKTEEMCKLIVQNKGMLLKNVRKDLQTEEMCKLAVQQNGYALMYVIKRFKTEEICRLAVQQNGMLIQHIKKDLLTEEICKLAVQQNEMLIHHIRKYVYEIVVEDNEYVLQCVEDKLYNMIKKYVN